MKTEPGSYPLVVTAAYRRTSKNYQLEGPAVCIPLVSSTGHGDAALHRVHFQEGKFALSNLLVALLPKELNICNPKYLYFLLMAKKDEYFVPLMLGTANVSLKVQDISGVQIPLPPVIEQLRIVAKIEELSKKVDEARDLRKQSIKELNSLLITMAHRDDLDDRSKCKMGWSSVVLEEVIRQTFDPHPVRLDAKYPNAGIYSFGRGLFDKSPIDGMMTSASSLNRIHSGQFIYSRLFAFEGAYGIVSKQFDGCFVSNEYPTFDCSDRIKAEFLFSYFKSPGIWAEVAAGSKGLGNRRQRVQPDRILSHRLMLPPVEWQEKICAVFAKVELLNKTQHETEEALSVLMPSVLSKVFVRQM